MRNLSDEFANFICTLLCDKPDQQVQPLAEQDGDDYGSALAETGAVSTPSMARSRKCLLAAIAIVGSLTDTLAPFSDFRCYRSNRFCRVRHFGHRF